MLIKKTIIRLIRLISGLLISGRGGTAHRESDQLGSIFPFQTNPSSIIFSAIWMTLRAAPLRMLSETIQRWSPFST